MRPHIAVAKAIINVPVPMMAWIGTRLALNLAVPLSQASNAKKLNKPTNSCKAKLIFVMAPVCVFFCHLKCEQSHSSKAKPGVDTVEMRKRVGSETLEVPDSNEAQSNAGDGEKVKHRVDELCVDSPTTRPSPGNNHSHLSVK